MNVISDVTQIIGKTPVIKLSKVPVNCLATIYAKLESSNPGGSVKDRLAYAMIKDAEQKQLIDEESVIIEPTSGNTGISLAMICAVRGYRLIVTMPESMSPERIALMKMYGAEVVLTPADLGMRGAIDKAEELVKFYPRSFIPYQFRNLANAKMHYETTAPELWEAMEGKIDVFIVGVGTGGTISGVGKFLKERNPAVKIIAIEPEDSPVMSGGSPGRHGIQGIGAGFIPEVMDMSVVDSIMKVSTPNAFETARELAREEGILCGISSGANVYGAIQAAKTIENFGKNIVTVICDTGERYLSTLPVIG
jgi:cysteine synthase A